ncbi:MAG: RlmE family RNA methyltransferase [Phycisphaerales bacterium]|nr:RlmE family RNA methyltransferase [Planctomycetota bacterium]
MAERRILHDEFFKKAKAEGYLARSAYKLKEIQERHRILRSGMNVVDLGCAPGSWLQVAREIVGAKGFVVGIDLQEVRHNIAPNVLTIVGDIFKADPTKLLADPARKFDVVLSDMAPSTSGHGDDALSIRLCRRVLELLPVLLGPGGACVMKVLEGGGYPALLQDCGRIFAKVKGLKPKASRDASREIFIIAEGYKPPAAKTQEPSAPARPRPGWGDTGSRGPGA